MDRADFFEKYFHYITYQKVPFNYVVNNYSLFKDKASEIYDDFGPCYTDEMDKYIRAAFKEAANKHIKEHGFRNNFEETKKFYV
jgi:hypothetical protein